MSKNTKESLSTILAILTIIGELLREWIKAQGSSLLNDPSLDPLDNNTMSQDSLFSFKGDKDEEPASNKGRDTASTSDLRETTRENGSKPHS